MDDPFDKLSVKSCFDVFMPALSLEIPLTDVYALINALYNRKNNLDVLTDDQIW